MPKNGKRVKVLVEADQALDLAQLALAAAQNKRISADHDQEHYHHLDTKHTCFEDDDDDHHHKHRQDDQHRPPRHLESASGRDGDGGGGGGGGGDDVAPSYEIDWKGDEKDEKAKMRAAVKASTHRDKHLRNSVRFEGLVYGGTSLGMSINSPLRRFCINVIETRTFETAVLLAILSNCVVIALESNSEPGMNGWHGYCQTAFTLLFTVELLLKSAAMGFAMNGRHSYIRDPWNVIDFLAVLFGYLVYLPRFRSNLTVIRMIRLLRPLRTISSVRGMRNMVGTLATSLNQLANVSAVLLFAFVFFGIAGMQLFGGKFHQRCELSESPYTINTDKLCGPFSKCDDGYTCKSNGGNPNRGVTGFDNFAQSCLTILTIMSLEGWFEISVFAMEATHPVAGLYFVSVVVMCAFFIVNLVVAVIFTAYDAQRKNVQKGLTTERADYIRRCNAEVRANQILIALSEK
eukprot:CAMPEP_0167825656 /NCGR_PEP_ID=MMETSP0112_2-20121227/9509_1 /TAXON_ID=91324 /ORGANISM="Lotharella globosa, Strain CCCM811" /LENGTH=460 /DNA_ID=CAMNT_0007727831 /DNA_START=316 /DNA_END=1696 /DNA_ORIENTATION=+